MLRRLSVFAILLTTVGLSVLAGNASASFHANGVVPLFCTSDTIPAGTPLQLRIRWVVKNSGQITKFLSGQSLTWTVTASDGSLLASSTPSPQYGDVTHWSAPVHSTGVDFNADGVPDDVYYADYLAPTGLTLAAGQTVTVRYQLTANVKTDDGFGTNIPAFTTITASGSTPCSVTGT